MSEQSNLLMNRESNLLKEGVTNWKLRLVLSALLSITGLGACISMTLGLFIDLSVWDKTLVALAIFIVGTPVYLIVSRLGQVDEYTIAGFLNEKLSDVQADVGLLLKKKAELDEAAKTRKKKLEAYFEKHPMYTLLPDRPVKQAYLVFVITVAGSFLLWYIG